MQGFGNEIAKGYGKMIMIYGAGIGAILFMLGLLIGFLLGGDSEKLKPIAEWDNPVGAEMRITQAMREANATTERLIEACNLANGKPSAKNDDFPEDGEPRYSVGGAN